MNEVLPVFRTYIAPQARARAAEVMARGWLGYGAECRELEDAFVRNRGGWALATASCTAALHVAALVARRGPAPEVIVPAMSFVSTAMAFHHAGYRVRLAPVDPRDLMVTARSVAPFINEATVAVVAVHLYGQRCADMPALRAVCDRHHLLLVEDCAHRIDLLDPQPPYGDLACYSFNAVKELPGGEGGLLWGSSAHLEPAARATSNVGLGSDTMQRSATARHGDYQFTSLSGLKLRCNDLAASLVNAALPMLPQWRSRRREQFAFYDAGLEPLHEHVRPLQRCTDDSRLMYVVRVSPARRDPLRCSMAQQQVSTSVHYPSLARHPLFCADAGSLSAFDADDSLLTLPTFLEMTDAQQSRIVGALAKAVADSSTGAAAGSTAAD